MRLRHHPATDTHAVIEKWLENQGQESDRLQAKVIADAVSNCLVISGSEEQLDVIRSIVQDLDQPMKSIRLKALLAELELPEAPQPGAEGTTSEIIQGDIGEVVSKLKERGKLRVLARPELLTTNNQPAFLQLGHRIPRITGTSASRGGRVNTMQLENVGTILGVTGRVADEDSVALEIDLERSHLEPEEEGPALASDEDGTAIRAAAIQTLTLQTTVSLRSGQTALIGGIVFNSEQGWREVLLLLQANIE
jgi:type II secretory pathway component GspD/PulD (secretin)